MDTENEIQAGIAGDSPPDVLADRIDQFQADLAEMEDLYGQALAERDEARRRVESVVSVYRTLFVESPLLLDEAVSRGHREGVMQLTSDEIRALLAAGELVLAGHEQATETRGGLWGVR